MEWYWVLLIVLGWLFLGFLNFVYWGKDGAGAAVLAFFMIPIWPLFWALVFGTLWMDKFRDWQYRRSHRNG